MAVRARSSGDVVRARGVIAALAGGCQHFDGQWQGQGIDRYADPG
jgi:hypothetical protein